MNNIVVSSSFTKIATLYNEIRPGYPTEMYNAIDNECKITSQSNILEIGAGNGIATAEIFQKWNSSITAVEPGSEFCQILNDRFKKNKYILIIKSTFENFKDECKYDFIFSGTAFHWINEKIKYKYSSKILKKNGKLVLFWNNYSRDDNDIFNKIQDIYTKYYPDQTEVIDIRKMQNAKITDRKLEILQSKYFNITFEKEFVIYRNYTSDKYIRLLKTFSNNSTKTEEQLSVFYSKIRELIFNYGNSLNLPIITNLIIASKK